MIFIVQCTKFLITFDIKLEGNKGESIALQQPLYTDTVGHKIPHVPQNNIQIEFKRYQSSH